MEHVWNKVEELRAQYEVLREAMLRMPSEGLLAGAVSADYLGIATRP
jgi:hypothetical protein